MKYTIKYLKNNKDGSSLFGTLKIHEFDVPKIKVIDKEKELIEYNGFTCRVQSAPYEIREKLGLNQYLNL